MYSHKLNNTSSQTKKNNTLSFFKHSPDNTYHHTTQLFKVQ